MREQRLAGYIVKKGEYMAIRIIEETVKDKWLVLAGLLQQQVAELASHKHLMELNPDMETYEAMEGAGCLLALFAYDGEEIVGYSANFIVPHMHYKDLLMCQNDVLYVDPDRRNGSFGLRLIQETERLAAERGARFITWHAKPNTRLEVLLPRLEYRTQEVVFSKEL